ncbi:MAG TPA: hypothetical protein VJ161_03560 [Geobacteraceae bacterium]|nr:hypothetical protein [Geobacteraceae bacterium]
MAFLGGVIGFAVGLVLIAAVATVLGASLAVFPEWVISLIPAAFGTFAASDPILALAFIVAIIILLQVSLYIIATAALADEVNCATTNPCRPTRLRDNPLELLVRGIFFGLNSAFNFGIWAMLAPETGILAILFGAVPFLAVIPDLARNRIYHAVLGWVAWLLPASYPATIVGLLLFLLNAPFAILAVGVSAIRLDVTTGVIETTGGIINIAGYSGGFSLGNFTFLANMGGLAGQGSFTGPSVSSHEIGHSLNTAAFGGIMLWINAVDENVPPFRRLQKSYGEVTADSHSGLPGHMYVSLWG